MRRSGTFVLGAWISLTGIAGVICGPGRHALIVALAGGGRPLVAGLMGWTILFGLLAT